MNRETSIQNLSRLVLSRRGILNFRNNTGALRDKDGRLVRYGLAKGSSDIIACEPVVITQDMVGQTIGRFLAVEVKCPGEKPTAEQLQFGAAVTAHGGRFIVVTSADEI